MLSELLPWATPSALKTGFPPEWVTRGKKTEPAKFVRTNLPKVLCVLSPIAPPWPVSCETIQSKVTGPH